MILAPMRNKEASTVAKLVMEHIILKWGLMTEVLSDQGPEFQAELHLSSIGSWESRRSAVRPIDRRHRVR